MRCIVADDEYLIRFSIIDMLRELESEKVVSFEILEQADDGQQLVEKFTSILPDLVFVDIRMPRLDGLQAMHSCMDRYPDAVWIILTGYAQFDYAKKALTLGAKDYLLKPASYEDLKHSVLIAQEAIEQKRRREVLELEHRLLSLQLDSGEEPTTGLGLFLTGFVVVIDTILDDQKAYEGSIMIFETLKRGFQTLGVTGFTTALDDGYPAVIIAAREQKQVDGCLRWAVDLLIETGRELSDQKISVISVKDPVLTIGSLLSRLKECSKSAPCRYLHGFGPFTSGLYGAGLSEELLETFDRALSQKDMHSVLSLRSSAQELERLVSDRLFSEDVMSFYSLPAGSVEALLDCLEERSRSRQPNQSRIAQKALQWIEEHFTEQIGLAQAAEALEVTPNYLSSQFHQSVGTPFTQYITELRMNRARELLESGRYTSKEVSLQVGYRSSRHFSKVFKHTFGFSPSQLIRFRG